MNRKLQNIIKKIAKAEHVPVEQVLADMEYAIAQSPFCRNETTGAPPSIEEFIRNAILLLQK